jgi:Tol biopolymer transport system component
MISDEHAGTITIWNAAGPVQTLPLDKPSTLVSPDHRTIAEFGSGDTVSFVDQMSGARLTASTGVNNPDLHSTLWSPSGRYLLIANNRDLTPGKSEAVVVDSQTGKVSQLYDEVAHFAPIAWGP